MIDEDNSHLEGANYFWFFAGVMFVAAVLFIFVARFYRGKTYIQDEEQDAAQAREEGIQ